MPNARRYETAETVRLITPNWITGDVATKRYARQAARRREIVDAVALLGLIAIALAWVLS